MNDEVVDSLIKIAVRLGEEIAIAIARAIRGGDVSAVQELSKVLEEPEKIALLDAALEAAQTAKAHA